jgi:hypothetical protein
VPAANQVELHEASDGLADLALVGVGRGGVDGAVASGDRGLDRGGGFRRRGLEHTEIDPAGPPVRRRSDQKERGDDGTWLITGCSTGLVPIPGTRRLERLDENLGAVAIDLTADDLAAIDAAAAEITVQGDRYPEAMQRMIDR